jgi:hypothetical protein
VQGPGFMGHPLHIHTYIHTGKRTKSRYFKGNSMDSLSLLYYDNKNVWMTSEILKKWLMSWDMELQRKSRKIITGS